MTIPKELRYSKEHEWLRVEGQIGVVGISEYAVEQLGDITLVEAPEKGSEITSGDAVGVIESVKAVSDLFTPVSGTVKEVNESLEDEPEKVNEDPYGEGWLMKIKLSKPEEVDGLLDAEGYQSFLDSIDE